MPPRIAVRDISFFERPIPFAKPFRFGSVVITSSVQVFVRAEIEIEGKGTSIGASAEMMASKWFDKRAHLSPQQTVDGLRRALRSHANFIWRDSGFDTAFGTTPPIIAAQVEACAKEDIPPLAAGFGPAEIDKAILDALLRGLGTNFFDGMAANVAGIDARLSPDLGDDDIAQFLRAASGWSASRSGIRSAWTTRSKARAASPTHRKTPARVISSSSSTAIPRQMRRA